MSETKLKMDWVNALPPLTFMDEPAIRDAFIQMNMKTRGTTQQAAEVFYEKESVYMKRVIYNSIDPTKPRQDLRRCTTFSLYACFMDMAINGDVLSFNPDDKLAYVQQRGYKVGKDENGGDVYEPRASMTISPYGELAIRQDYGQVKYADPVVVVYDGDAMDIGTDDRGNTLVIWRSKVPRASKKIIGSFVKITRADGSFIMSYLLQEDIDRLAQYSNRNNFGKGSNALYGAGDNGMGIDAGFLKAKTLKHAFKSFPKVKLKGTNSDIEGDQPEITEDDLNAAPALIPQQRKDPFAPGFDEPVYQDDSFTPAPTGKPGVTVKNPDEEETF